MAWRTSPLPPDWPAIRKRILERDGGRCTVVTNGNRCPHAATDVHHLGDSQDHRDEMLASVCSWHHRRATSAQGNAKRRRVSTRREPERHPGLRD